MIYGVGTDIIEVDRVRKTMEADPGFQTDVFTPGEIEYCSSKIDKYPYFAARFCAKEAFLKALGKGIFMGIKLSDIEVLNDDSGRPFIRLNHAAKDMVKDLAISKIHVSLAHLKEIANAVVIIEKEDIDIEKQA